MAEKTDFILEIGVEEVPASLLFQITNHIKAKLEESLAEAELCFKESDLAYTPRRLVVFIRGLEQSSSDKELEIKGPPEKIAVDDKGAFSQAALGFAKKNNLDESELFVEGGYLRAKTIQKGVDTKSYLAEKIPEIISKVPGERFMRSGKGELKFSRPFQWFLALLGSETISFELEGLSSSNLSYGHRFLSPASFAVKDEKDYLQKLEKNNVTLKAEDRKKQLVADAEKLVAELGNAELHVDDELLDEVANILEKPKPVLCSFDEKFLQIPSQVLITVMAVHQRYFPVLKKGSDKNELLPYFVAVSNNPLAEAEANVRSGNEKVIIPRFKDAEFFVEEDMKLSLEDRLAKLEQINFQAGNLLQKSKRIEKIVEYLIKELKDSYDHNPSNHQQETLKDKKIQGDILKAAKLAKSDLTTQLVFEFTELQGEIGAVYAEKQGLSALTAAAIAEHYYPRFAGDSLPATIGSKLISVADKLDNLLCFFAAGKIPKGSADPFALRRQANGMLEIILHSHFILDVSALVDFAAELGEQEFGQGRMIKKVQGRGEKRKEIEVPEFDWQKAKEALKEFLEQRLAFVFELNHKNSDVNKAVLATGSSLAKINTKHLMVHLVSELKQENKFNQLSEAISRLVNISDSKSDIKVSKSNFKVDAESCLFDSLQNLEKKLDQKAEYESLINTQDLIQLVEPINQFFDEVLVNDKDEKIKKNRQALVAYGAGLFSEICDFRELA